VFLGLEAAYFTYWSDQPRWLVALPPLILLWPGWRAVRRSFTKAVIVGERLRYESGVVSRSTRNVQIPKIQDVRVDQTLIQRMFGIGDLSIETAGETSRLTLQNVDSPQKLADEILDRAHHGPEV
jgi:uncharacterized membrane protein YdbT with pleckstrin-like domain